MAAGYLSNGQCVASYQAAAQQFCAQFPKVVSTGSDPVTYSCSVVGTSGEVLLAAQVGQTNGGSSQFTPYYATCNTETFNNQPWALSVSDAVDVSWLVVGVWAIAWASRQVAKHFNQTVSDT